MKELNAIFSQKLSEAVKDSGMNYAKLAEKEEHVIFGGRLGEYKYYDMDKVIEVALDVAAKELA